VPSPDAARVSPSLLTDKDVQRETAGLATLSADQVEPPLVEFVIPNCPEPEEEFNAPTKIYHVDPPVS